MSHKKGHPFPQGLEVAFGIAGRAGLKKGVHRFMSWLRKTQPDLFNHTVFLYTSPKAAAAKTVFQGAIITGTVLIENIGDAIKVPEPVMGFVETIFADVPGTIGDYFEIEKPVLPEGYVEPQLDANSVKQLAGQLNANLRGWIVGILAGWDKPVQKVLGLIGRNQTEQVMSALRVLDDTQWKNFDGFISSLTPEDQELMAHMLQYFNTPEEVTDWADYRLDRQLEMFEFAKRMHDNRLLGRMIRFGKRNWPKIKDEMSRVLAQANAGLGVVEQAFAADNVRRKAEIDRARYAPAELKEDKKPWRNRELPDGDKRRQAPEPRLFGLFRWGWQEITVLAFIALVIVLALVSGIGGCMTKPPVVAIISTNTVQNEQLLKLTGTVQADYLVSRVEYQVNGGSRIPVRIWSARQVNWSFKIKPPAAGTTVTVYAYDPRAKNPGVTSIKIEDVRSH